MPLKSGSSEHPVVAIIGASPKPGRLSGTLYQRLKADGWSVFAVHPALTEIFGDPVYSTLAELPMAPGLISLYVNAQASSDLAAEIIASGANKVIFNPGAENPELAMTLSGAGVETENACSLVLHGVGGL
jgi:predicted CoA-binding protein